MNIPKSIKMGVHKLIVEQDKLPCDVSPGFIELDTGVITIDKDLSDSIKMDVIIHEVLEFIKSQYNLKLSHNDLTVIGVAMLQFISENIEWLDQRKHKALAKKK